MSVRFQQEYAYWTCLGGSAVFYGGGDAWRDIYLSMEHDFFSEFGIYDTHSYINKLRQLSSQAFNGIIDILEESEFMKNNLMISAIE